MNDPTAVKLFNHDLSELMHEYIFYNISFMLCNLKKIFTEVRHLIFLNVRHVCFLYTIVYNYMAICLPRHYLKYHT